MIHKWKIGCYNELGGLFEDYRYTRAIILPALVEDRGELWVDDLDNPKIARLLLGGINFFGGDSTKPLAKELVATAKPMEVLMAPSNDWNDLFREVWSERLDVHIRTKFSAESLDINYLRGLMNKLGDEFILERADFKTIKHLDKRHSMHIPLFFGSSAKFIERGIAFCIKHGDRVVSMASTYAPFIDEFEIQVMTVDDVRYRRKGLATIVSAALIVYALEHDLTPQWDAANDESIKLALKLGYTDPVKYESFYVKPPSD